MMRSELTKRWLVYADSNAHTKLRLFCFPYAGGSASIFTAWPRALPSEVTVCPIQLPGRGSRMREKPFARVGELLNALVPALEPLLDRPFALFGHSMGGLISYELTRELQRRKLPLPRHVFISAFRAPTVPDRDPPLHGMSDSELIAEMTRLNGTPPEVLRDRELLQMLMPLVRADAAVCETYAYAPGTTIDVPISVFGGVSDPKITRADLEEWRNHTRGPFTLRMMPGDHFFIHHSTELMSALRGDLHALVASLRGEARVPAGGRVDP